MPRRTMMMHANIPTLIAIVSGLLMVLAQPGLAQQPKKTDTGSAAAAAQMADFFGKIGDQIYEECIYELSQEQLEVQHALITAYVQQGAPIPLARKLAVKQIRPPKLSENCERIRAMPKAGQPKAEPSVAEIEPPADVPAPPAKKPVVAALPKLPQQPQPQQPPPQSQPPAASFAPAVALANKQVLPQWDCAPGVDYVTIDRNGYRRKLTGGEICNPFEDVVAAVPASVGPFRFGYTIRTGRLFIISDNPQVNGKTIAWAISGREVCRNNPDPDCFAARAIGPLPPGEYIFNSDQANRVSWGPKTKRQVAGIYLKKLWNKERFTPAQTSAVMARGNIAIHMRLKGEMSEACLGLEPKAWTYVSSLIKDGRVTGVNAYIDEPYPQVAENPPVIVASSFSLTSLFK